MDYEHCEVEADIILRPPVVKRVAKLFRGWAELVRRRAWGQHPAHIFCTSRMNTALGIVPLSKVRLCGSTNQIQRLNLYKNQP